MWGGGTRSWWLYTDRIFCTDEALDVDDVRVLVNEVKIPLHEAVRMATSNPAGALGSKTKGRLEPGADADFVVLSPELEVLQTFVAGERIFAL